MTDSFFDRPILNSPYALPMRHWELDDVGQPTQRITERIASKSLLPTSVGADVDLSHMPIGD